MIIITQTKVALGGKRNTAILFYSYTINRPLYDEWSKTCAEEREGVRSIQCTDVADILLNIWTLDACALVSSGLSWL